MLWLLEHDIFLSSGHPLAQAVRRAGDRVQVWDDSAWSFQELPPATDEPTVFHGSLGNADKIAALKRWTPGAYCNTAEFRCSAWYERLSGALLNQSYAFTTVRELVAAPDTFKELFGGAARVFVRPDSPLKPFSGRVVALTGLIADHLDHGFYYDDLDLPIVVSPRREDLGQEWRFVVVDGEPVTSSAYVADGRAPQEGSASTEVLGFAAQVAASFASSDPAYVLDVVETPSGPRLLEVNPFSGADLYRCDPDAVVAAVRGLFP